MFKKGGAIHLLQQLPDRSCEPDPDQVTRDQRSVEPVMSRAVSARNDHIPLPVHYTHLTVAIIPVSNCLFSTSSSDLT